MSTQERKPLPIYGDEIQMRGGMLMKCERVIASLGEDGVKPMAAAEFKKVKAELGFGTPEMKAVVTRPLFLGPQVLDWQKTESVHLDLLKAVLPREELIVHSQLEAVSGMGAKELNRQILMQASWDYACMERISDEGLVERFLATRLKTFDDYLSRKLYAFSLGLMEFRE